MRLISGYNKLFCCYHCLLEIVISSRDVWRFLTWRGIPSIKTDCGLNSSNSSLSKGYCIPGLWGVTHRGSPKLYTLWLTSDTIEGIESIPLNRTHLICRSSHWRGVIFVSNIVPVVGLLDRTFPPGWNPLATSVTLVHYSISCHDMHTSKLHMHAPYFGNDR